MIAYLDASALAALLLRDRGAEAIGAWLDQQSAEPCVSDFGLGEATSAVALRYRRGALALDQARRLVTEIAPLTADWRNVAIAPGDIARATGFVARLDLALRLPDAIHIAVAWRTGSTFVTTDHQQARAADALGLAVVNPPEGTTVP